MPSVHCGSAEYFTGTSTSSTGNRAPTACSPSVCCHPATHPKVHDQRVHGAQVGPQRDGQLVQRHIVLPRILNHALNRLNLRKVWGGLVVGQPVRHGYRPACLRQWMTRAQGSCYTAKEPPTSCFITASNCCATPLSPRVSMSNTLATDAPPPLPTPCCWLPAPMPVDVNSAPLVADAAPATSAAQHGQGCGGSFRAVQVSARREAAGAGGAALTCSNPTGPHAALPHLVHPEAQ